MDWNQNICLLKNIYTLPPPSELHKDCLSDTLLDIAMENELEHKPNKVQREGNVREAEEEVNFNNKKHGYNGSSTISHSHLIPPPKKKNLKFLCI